MDDEAYAPPAVIVIMRFPGEARLLFPKWESALESWRERFPDNVRQSFAGESQFGGLVVVNRFASDDDYLNFVGTIGDLLAHAMLPAPEIEYVMLSERVPSREIRARVTA